MKIDSSWKEIFESQYEKLYFDQLKKFILSERKTYKIYPKPIDVFNAFVWAKLDEIKIVVLAQDPYVNPGQAHGIAFSVPDGIDKPPSLKNIFKELKNDLGIEEPKSGSLVGWAKQGVLLLNSTMTVRDGKPGSHFGVGWETFTDYIIGQVSDRGGTVFMLWGAKAQEKLPWIDGKKNLILTSTHPSPLSAHRGFLGCKHFSKANEYLKDRAVNWDLNTEP